MEVSPGLGRTKYDRPRLPNLFLRRKHKVAPIDGPSAAVSVIDKMQRPLLIFFGNYQNDYSFERI